MTAETCAVIVSAVATVAYAVVTLWLANITHKMAKASQATLEEMRRQFDLLHLPSLVLLVHNQHAEPDGDRGPHMTFRLANFGGGPALYPRVWCSWAAPDTSEVGRLHVDESLGNDHCPRTCAAGAVLSEGESGYFRLSMPAPDGRLTVEWKVSASGDWRRQTWSLRPSGDARTIWVASPSAAEDGPSPFGSTPLVLPAPDRGLGVYF